MVGSGVVTVVVLSFVMFMASFGAGTVPLAMSLNQERMGIVSSLGVGLLVGTSLGVVLPEGIEMLYTSVQSAARHQLPRKAESIVHDGDTITPTDDSYHLAMALALVLGYLVMHLLTFLPPLLLSRNPQTPTRLASLPSSPRLERSDPSITNTPTGLSNTTIGLCIHALADGIALGSSAIGNNVALEGIVFLAIMLHKAPASFSLTAILLRESYPRNSIRRQLLLFALSSPISTLFTYFALSAISLNQQNVQFRSGSFLLFSAGTLIFASANVHLHTSEEDDKRVMVQRNAVRELLAGAVGICVPLLLGSLGHGH